MAAPTDVYTPTALVPLADTLAPPMAALPLLPAGLPPLRRYRAVVFDWDGTAVANRREDATPVAGLIEALLRLGTWMVVVTGTSLEHVDRQLLSLLPRAVRRRLVVSANRGSEIYTFGRGRPRRRWARVATAEEEYALTRAAETARAALVTRTGLTIDVIHDRLNRRKLDLMPDPAWADPPKLAIRALLVAVEERLGRAGLTGGLAEAIALTRQVADAHGLADARITSDAKHVELGLTDKGDVLPWIEQHVLRPAGLGWSDVLVVGDELGPVAGLPGGDARLRPLTPGATVVSVGIEPNGVPADVLQVPGGPAAFRRLLAEQIRLHRPQTATPASPARAPLLGGVLEPSADPAWRLEALGYDPTAEPEVESRFTTCNGLLSARGSLEEVGSGPSPRTYVAGLFSPSDDNPAVPGLAPAPDWLRLQLYLDGEPVSVVRGEVLAHRRILDLRTGTLWRDWTQRDADGRLLQVRTLRFVSLADRALAVQVVQVAVASPAHVTLKSWIEPPAAPWSPEVADDDLALWRGAAGDQLALASATTLLPADPEGLQVQRGVVGSTRVSWDGTAASAEPVALVRVTALARGGDASAPAAVARAAVQAASQEGMERLLAAHAQAWAERWAASDVEVGGDPAAQHTLRFALYHLLSAANPRDPTVSIGARALTGDGYLGHVFWDTELYLLPFYTFTWPQAARALLLYRYHTLPAARAKAARLGYRGACYAWESAGSGEEATPPYVHGPQGQVILIANGTQELHITAAVAYAVWQYRQASGDTEFLLQAGAEMLLETARFWASRAERGADGRYHLEHVIGPDEYHGDVADNAYTNQLARWNLERALELARTLPVQHPGRWAELEQQLGLSAEELADWETVAAGLVTGFDPARGLIEQFAGFFDLQPIYVAGYEPREIPMDVILGAERTQRTQVVKQADVVMLLMLLWDQFSPEAREANFRYYEARCGHGSSLSPTAHAVVAARLGDTAFAERLFRQAGAVDLSDTYSNAALGVHIATQGGLWQVAVFGFGGLALADDGLRFDPRLPRAWPSLAFPVQWRGRHLRVAIQGEPLSLAVTFQEGDPMVLHVGRLDHQLAAGETWICRWEESRLEWVNEDDPALAPPGVSGPTTSGPRPAERGAPDRHLAA